MSKTMKIGEILRFLDRQASPATAETWDNVGLLIGDPEWKTDGAVISIDLTEEAIETARAKKYRLIVTHHPCIFPKSRGLSRVVAGRNSGMPGLVFEALRHGIAVCAYHTNFDQCALEVVGAVSKGLGAVPRGRLHERGTGTLVKLVTFVPPEHLEQIREKVCEAGAGHIGNYDSCAFVVEGEGSFRGREGSRPFIGKMGVLEKTKEVRFETIFPRGLQKEVVGALLSAHPYEEVAYDLYAVEQAPSSKGLTKGLGYGFWGEFPSPKPFSEVVKDVRSVFNLNGFLLTDAFPSRVQASRKGLEIKRVAFVAGKGASFVESAASLGCDLFITGEAGYHTALDGSRKKMAVMELGHRESERFFLVTMKDWLAMIKVRSVQLDVPTQEFA